MAKLNRDKTSYERELEEKLQSLRQRNEELEQSLVAEAVNKQEFKDLQTQILSLQLTIEKMREVLEKLARLGNEPNYGNSEGNDTAREALSLQPSTAELAEHDEAIRVEEREACWNTALNAENLIDACEAIRQRKIS